MNRRELLQAGAGLATVAATGGLVIAEGRAAPATAYAPIFPLLDRFVAQYLKEMNAPGLTLSLADGTGVQRIVAYGFDDLAQRTPLDVERLFHIGSISKSFLGLALLQLCDEGKLDLHRPIRDYLPWLRVEDATRPLTAHDFLTHGAALPDGALFPADPAFRHRATAAPGSFFHYSNLGYEALGHLLAKLDGRPLPEALRARLLAPLGMTASEPVITLDMLERTAASYTAYQNDRPYPRYGRLAPAAAMVFTLASGCIAATARDMASYLAMLINRGRGPRGPLVSADGFRRFATAHIAAEEFGPGAHYGYGIAVDQLDGHARLRHTGGMVSFASALEVDLDAGVGVFASINAMQGFRPRPVAEYALRLMRASREGTALPAVPQPVAALHVERAADYAGRYAGAAGRTLETLAEGARLYLLHGKERVPLEPAIGTADGFNVLHRDFARYPLVFERDGGRPDGAIVAAGWGEAGFVRDGYSPPPAVPAPPEWQALVGHYRSENPWIASHHIVLRRGRLWLDGAVPLEAAAGGRFYLRDEPTSPEWVDFGDVADGVPMRMRLSGFELLRVFAP